MPPSQFFLNKAKKQKSKQSEITLNTALTIDELISWFNYILLCERVSPDTAKELIGVFETEINEKKDKACIERCFKPGVHFASVTSIYDHVLPWIGSKALSKAFGAKDAVIGLQGECLRYRIDFDPVKGLHVNLETSTGLRLAICISNLASKRFGMSDEMKTGEAGKYQAEFIKFKAWLKMTLGCFISRGDLASAFTPFLRLPMESFVDFRNQIQKAFSYDEKMASLIEGCRDETGFIKLFFTNPIMRHQVINHIMNMLIAAEGPIFFLSEVQVDSEGEDSVTSMTIERIPTRVTIKKNTF